MSQIPGDDLGQSSMHSGSRPPDDVISYRTALYYEHLPEADERRFQYDDSIASNLQPPVQNLAVVSTSPVAGAF